MANIYDLSDTWNEGSTTFTSIKMNVDDQASASGSLLMDFTTSVNVSEANSQRILAYLVGGTSYGTVTEEDGTKRQATTEEAAQAFALGILQGLLNQTVRYEKDMAAKAAAEAVAPITPE